MSDEPNTRQRLRASLLAEAPPVTIEIDGETYELKIPSIKTRRELLPKLPPADKDGQFRIPLATAYDVGAEIVFTHLQVPGTGERVFDPTDREQFEKRPANPVVDRLFLRAFNLLFPGAAVPGVDPKAGGTETSSSSSAPSLSSLATPAPVPSPPS